MTTKRPREPRVSSLDGDAPRPASAFLVFIIVFGLAMLSLFAVLALAGVVALADLVGFFALPLLLFAACGLLVQRWVREEARE